MLAIIRMIVVLSSICGLSGFALSYLKISTAPRIEEQVLTYVQGPAILKVFADIDNSPIAERKTFTLDGAKVTVFPGKKDGKLVAVALEHFGKGFGGDVGVMVGYDVNRDTLTGIGITTMKETPGLGTRVADPAFTGQFTGKPADARLKSQGGDIDAVSGATLTSNAVFTAMDSCLAQAGTGSAGAEDLTDGTYTSSAKGCLSDVEVTVTVSGGKVSEVAIDASGETPELGGAAAETLADALTKAGSTNGVDAVSGATLTSEAVFTAMNDCLSQAQ